jgi:hypothetical protein
MVIAPTRMDYQFFKDYRGYEAYHQAKLSYPRQLSAVANMLQTVHNVQDTLQHLTIHRVSLFDNRLFKLMVMGIEFPRLEYLSVTGCELLHFGTTFDLLRTIKIRNLPDSGLRPIRRFDFYPRYHEGPDDITRYGSFGVSYNDAGLNTAHAVLGACTVNIWPLAEELGFDFITPSSPFRQFLERIPLPKWSLALTIDLYSRWKGTLAEGWRISHRGRKAGWASRDMYMRHEKLYKAMTPPLSRPENLDGFFGTARFWCIFCNHQLPLWMKMGRDPCCKGCELADILRKEPDHYKLNKVYVISRWLQAREDPKQLLEEEVESLDDIVDVSNGTADLVFWQPPLIDIDAADAAANALDGSAPSQVEWSKVVRKFAERGPFCAAPIVTPSNIDGKTHAATHFQNALKYAVRLQRMRDANEQSRPFDTAEWWPANLDLDTSQETKLAEVDPIHTPGLLEYDFPQFYFPYNNESMFVARTHPGNKSFEPAYNHDILRHVLKPKMYTEGLCSPEGWALGAWKFGLYLYDGKGDIGHASKVFGRNKLDRATKLLPNGLLLGLAKKYPQLAKEEEQEKPKRTKSNEGQSAPILVADRTTAAKTPAQTSPDIRSSPVQHRGSGTTGAASETVYAHRRRNYRGRGTERTSRGGCQSSQAQVWAGQPVASSSSQAPPTTNAGVRARGNRHWAQASTSPRAQAQARAQARGANLSAQANTRAQPGQVGPQSEDMSWNRGANNITYPPGFW